MNNKIFCGSHDLTETTAEVTTSQEEVDTNFMGGEGNRC